MISLEENQEKFANSAIEWIFNICLNNCSRVYIFITEGKIEKYREQVKNLCGKNRDDIRLHASTYEWCVRFKNGSWLQVEKPTMMMRGIACQYMLLDSKTENETKWYLSSRVFPTREESESGKGKVDLNTRCYVIDF